MSSSSWPPQLKAWVQECLSKATPSNKAAVNAELKQILFKAHKDGSLNTTDWSKVHLEALRSQNIRTTHIPPPVQYPSSAPVPIPPPTITTYHTPYPTAFPPAPASVDDGSNSSSAKKKRKKKNSVSGGSSFPTPYHFVSDSAEAEALAKRAARFSKPTDSGPVASAQPTGVNGWFGGDGVVTDGSGVGDMIPGQLGRKKMKGKAGLGYNGVEVMEVDPNVLDWDSRTIKGTNTKLEKKYLRLTSEPSPADIRPLHVLKQTLQLLKEKWKENHNYAYAVDQFKSMRQDLTVQRIKNEFTVEVYEIHGRIALEAKDLGEYNQCQTMLRQLYELGIRGHPQEFLSYRIIYLLHTRNRSDMASLLAQLTPAEKADPGVHHALQVHASLATSNYVRFFRLFTSAPSMSGYIMDHFVERERMSALAIMSKAYMTLPITYLTQTLAFESDVDTDKFLDDHKIAIYTNDQPPPPPPSSSTHWRPLKHASAKTPLNELVWDCKKSQAGCTKGMERYRVVDLKGQVD